MLAGKNLSVGLEWLGAWWKHYGNVSDTNQHELYIVQVRDGQGRIVGLSPFRRSRRGTWGRVVQFLGDGDACTDHLTLLAEEQDRAAITDAIASWMLQQSECPRNGWDHVELIGADAHDSTVAQFVKSFGNGGARVHQRSGTNCWCMHLPACWDAYERAQSKNFRKNLKRYSRLLSNDELKVNTVKTHDELDRAWPILLELHGKRRAQLGDEGCFASPRFTRFLREAAERFLESEALLLPVLYWGRNPIAVEIQFRRGNRTSAYQSGMDPEFAQFSPGAVLMTWTVQECIKRGDHFLDLLRGDEPYKLRWNPTRCATVEYRIAARRVSARIQHGAWVAGSTTLRWLRNRGRQVSVHEGVAE